MKKRRVKKEEAAIPEPQVLWFLGNLDLSDEEAVRLSDKLRELGMDVPKQVVAKHKSNLAAVIRNIYYDVLRRNDYHGLVEAYQYAANPTSRPKQRKKGL